MICDHCLRQLCEIDGCENQATWEMWFGVGGSGLCAKLKVCDVHKADELRLRNKRLAA